MSFVIPEKGYQVKPIMTYISHPFQNKQDNVEKVKQIIEKLQKQHPERIFISPVLSFGFLYDKMSYEDGMDWCYELLRRCDDMWVFGDYKNSLGCGLEITYCRLNRIPYIIREDIVL